MRHAMTRMKSLVLVFVLAVSSCRHTQTRENGPWEPDALWNPSKAEVERAEKIARQFALDEHISRDEKLDKMKAHAAGYYSGARRLIFVQFYDPSHIQPVEFNSWTIMDGGRPHYFTVTIDANAWTVWDHSGRM